MQTENSFKSDVNLKNLVSKEQKMTFFFFAFFCISRITSTFAQDIITKDYDVFTQLRKDDKAMETFLMKNDDVLYRQFQKGVSFRQSGKGWLGTGLFTTGGSIALMVISASKNSDSNTRVALINAGYVGFCLGQAFIIVSIPLSAVGGNLKKRATNDYEKKYFGNYTKSRASLNFCMMQTGGIGLALNF